MLESHPNTGLILVDHGSRKGAANEMLVHVVELFRQLSGMRIVEPAHMELAEPTLEQAFDKCVAQGARAVMVHPYFLAPGRHSTTDIPRMVSEAAARHPGVRAHVTPPLGLDEKITRVILDRVNECLQANLQCETCADRPCAAAHQKTVAPAAEEEL